MKKYVSFVAPMYNMEKYLIDFLESFKKIESNNFELIVVNNASTDNSLAICEKYKSQINLKLINSKENLAVGLGRNLGVENLSNSSTHVIFIDPDDCLIDDFDFNKLLELCDDKIKINKAQLKWNKKGVKKFNMPLHPTFKGSGTSVAWGNIYPSKLVRKWKFTVKFYEDFAWLAKLTSENDFEFIDYPFIKYRIRKSSITNSIFKFPDRLNDFKDEAYRVVEQKLVKNNNFKSIYRMIFDIYVLEGYSRGFKKISWDGRFDFLNISKKKVFWIVFFQRITRTWWWFSIINNMKAFR